MTTQASGWLTIREAALALGVSDLTIRRRIKDGKLRHRLEAGKYYVRLDGPTNGHAEASVGLTDDDHGEYSVPDPVIRLETVMGEYARLAESAGRAALLEEELRRLQEQSSAQQQTLLTLSNRNGWLESKLEEREVHIKLLTDSRRRSWWQRLFGSRGAGD